MSSKHPSVEPPESLAKLQRGFGKAVSTPFRFIDDTGTFQTQNEAYPKEIVALIAPRPDKGLSGSDRLATYNCQYWFRLFSTMQKEYPLLRHLIGSADLNKLVSDYLTQFPPNTHDLGDIADHLQEYLADTEMYNLPIIHQAAQLDLCYNLAFAKPHHPPIRAEQLADYQLDRLLSQPLRFQPHWFLFQEDWALMETRARVKSIEEDIDDVNPSPTRGYWAVWRARAGVTETALGPLQFHLLDLLRNGSPLDAALEALTAALEPENTQFLSDNIQAWFAEWVAMGWLLLPESKKSVASVT